MDWSYRHLRGRLFAPDEKGGGGTDVDEAEAMTTDEAATEETSETESTQDEDKEPEDKADEEENPEPKPRDLTDDEVRERAAKLGMVVPEEKKEEPKPEVKTSRFDAPDFRAKAYEEVLADPNAKTNGWIDDEGDVTVEGQRVAENHALLLAAQHVGQARDSEQFKTQFAAQKPALVTAYSEEVKKMGVEEASAPEVAKDYVDLLESYGERAFKEDDNGKHLRTTAYYIALGMQKEREMKAAQEGGNTDADRAKEPAGGGAGDGGSLYQGLPKDEVDWLKTEWAKTKNGGKPPTREQIKELKAQGVIG